MSLISQNVLRQKQIQKVGEEEPDETLPNGSNEEEEEEEVSGGGGEENSNVAAVKDRKRRKEPNGKDKELVMMEKVLSSSLFGSTYSPLKFEANDEGEENSNMGIVKGKKRKKEEKNEKDKELVMREKALNNSLFGSIYSPLKFGANDEGEAEDEVSWGADLFFMDRSGIREVETFEDNDQFPNESNGLVVVNKDKKPAWVDDEEEGTQVDITKVNRLRKLRKEENETWISGLDYVSRLRAQHVKLNPGTDWAQIRSHPGVDDESDEEANGVVITQSDDDDDDTEDVHRILRTNETLVRKNGVKLLPGILEYSRLVNANAEEPSNGPINSVQFHRNSQLLLSAGLDRRLRFFQIDGKRNTKVQSIFLEDCPIHKASFLPDGSQVIAAGRRKFFYSFDLVKAKFDKIGPLTGREEKSLETFEVSPDSRTIAFVGNEGYILLVSCQTKELIGTLKMNGSARALAFADDGRQLLSTGGDGHVYHWDLRTRTCFHKAVDEGCLTGSALCTSLDGALFAAGSTSGIVNIYDKEVFLGGKRKPLKTIENLTTSIDFMKFNHDSQILAICSTLQKNSLKLVHVPSFSVFSNWPPPNRTLHHPRCLDFSPGGGFMAVGNAAGKVLLYKLHHYQHA